MENTHDNIAGEVDQSQSEHASLVSLNDADDEFFDFPEPSDCDESEAGWMPDCSQRKSQVQAIYKNFAASIALQKDRLN